MSSTFDVRVDDAQTLVPVRPGQLQQAAAEFRSRFSPSGFR